MLFCIYNRISNPSSLQSNADSCVPKWTENGDGKIETCRRCTIRGFACFLCRPKTIEILYLHLRRWSYRVFIKYCVFSLKCCDCRITCVWPAIVYTHWHRGKTKKGQSPEYFKIFGKKHNILWTPCRTILPWKWHLKKKRAQERFVCTRICLHWESKKCLHILFFVFWKCMCIVG